MNESSMDLSSDFRFYRYSAHQAKTISIQFNRFIVPSQVAHLQILMSDGISVELWLTLNIRFGTKHI